MKEFVESQSPEEPRQYRHGEPPVEGAYAESIEPEVKPNAELGEKSEAELEVKTETDSEKAGVETTASTKNNDDKSGKKSVKKISARNIGIAVGVVSLLIVGFIAAQVWMNDAMLGTFVITGNRLVTAEEITGKVSEHLGKRLEDISLSEIEKTVERHSFIRNAVATKELPNAIRIRITERQPVAVASLGGELRLIDDGGNVLDFETKVFETKRLPLLTGFHNLRRDTLSKYSPLRIDSSEISGAALFLLALAKTEHAKLFISEVCVSEPKKMFALTADGDAKFIFGDRGNYSEKLERFEVFWKEVIVKRGVKNFESVDFRFEKKVFARELNVPQVQSLAAKQVKASGR